jgi:ABC-type antimicrobial peptide transport system permease subunit
VSVFALRNLLRRKIRTVLTMLGVAIGVAAVVALVSVMQSIRAQFDQFFATGSTHLVASRRGAADPLISYLPESLLEELARCEGVAAVHPFIFGATQIPQQPFLFFYGVTPDSPFLGNVSVIEGEGLFESPGRRVCLGRQLADALHLTPGDTLRLGEDEYEVAGLFASSMPLVDTGALLPFRLAQQVAGLEGKMNSAMLQLEVLDEPSLVRTEASLEEAFPDLEVSRPADFTGVFDEFELMDQAVWVISVLAVLVGGIGVMNTMIMSVFERTREFGVLQAIGWSKAMILQQVLVEAALLGLLGGILGVGLGILMVEATGSVMELGWIAGTYEPGLMVLALVVAQGMGLVGAAYPTVRAVRITPIEALRHE